jgi:hypothetical protein
MIAALLSLGTHILAVPVETDVATTDDAPIVDIDDLWYEFGPYNETASDFNDLQTRQTDETYDCTLDYISAPKPGYRTFLDSIPDRVIDMRTTRMPFSYTAFIGNFLVQAYIVRTQGTVASGGNIRGMGHRGWTRCVANGGNDLPGDSSRFLRYMVENPGYRIYFGSGIPACRNGGSCEVLPNPP